MVKTALRNCAHMCACVDACVSVAYTWLGGSTWEAGEEEIFQTLSTDRNEGEGVEMNFS